MKRRTYIPFLFSILVSALLFSQNISPIAFDLAAPIDVNLDANGTPWVTQSGTGANDGLVQKVNPDGTKETIIEGLPSYFDFMLEELQGPLSTQVMADGRIFVCQGAGPDSLSQTIMEFHWDDYVAKGAPLVAADRRSTIWHGEWVLANGFDESNPYSFLMDGDGNFLISDAAANAIIKYNVDTEEFSVLTEFPSFQNPTPIGPPFVQVVPTKILTHPDGGYLVSSLTGFPFLDGASNIYRVQEDGTTSVYASGLTLVTDMDWDPNDGELVALQFAAFGPVDTSFSFIFNSAQLIKVHETGALDTIAAGFGPGPGLAFAADGSAYLTHLFLGQLLKSDPLSTHVFDWGKWQPQPMTVFPNPNDGRFTANIFLENPAEVTYRLIDLLGREVATGLVGHLPTGENTVPLNFSNNSIGHGAYQLSLFTEREFFVSKIIIQ